MIDIKIGDGVVGWNYPDKIGEISLSDYLRFCKIKMPDWFRELRETEDVVRRKEIEEMLDKDLDMRIELLRYWGEVVCVFAKPFNKDIPELGVKMIEGMSVDVEGIGVVRFEAGVENLRALWEIVDGNNNIFDEYKKKVFSDKEYLKNENYLFRYKDKIWGIDTPYMRRSKLVEYIESRFWSEVLENKSKGVFGEALGKLVGVLVREWIGKDLEDKEGCLKEVMVEDFTEYMVEEKERYFGELGMDVVMDIGFFLYSRVNSLKRGLKMPIESLRALKGLAELMR